MTFSGKDIISALDFTREEFNLVIGIAGAFSSASSSRLGGFDYSVALKGKTIAALFLQNSIRTRGSFEKAAKNLGADFMVFDQGEVFEDNVKPEESLEDILTTISGLGANAIILRSPQIYTADLAECKGAIPIINAGDRNNEHPTQAFVDIYTIMQTQGRVDGLKIGIVGDLENSRAAHSLCYALSKFNVELYLISDDSMKMPVKIVDYAIQNGLKIVQEDFSDLNGRLPELDIAYAVRKQWHYTDQAHRDNDRYFIITNEMLEGTKKNFSLLHPLSRGSEIPKSLDKNPKAVYFTQNAYRIPVNQAILSLWLKDLR